jgi:hypothetical protein
MTQLTLKLGMKPSMKPAPRAARVSLGRSKRVEILKCTVYVIQSDIDGGCRCDANRCMHKVAIARTLSGTLKVEVSSLRVRVDATGIRFHYKGYRWHAVLPQKVKTTLIAYDNPKTRDTVKPHTYTFHATRGAKVIPITPERQQQMYDAQLARVAAGEPDRTRHRSLRSRIVGIQ